MDPAQEQPPQRATPRQIAAGVACLLLLGGVVVYGTWYVLIGGSISAQHDRGNLIGQTRQELVGWFGSGTGDLRFLGWDDQWVVGELDLDTSTFVAVRYGDDGRVAESGLFSVNYDAPHRPWVMWLGSFRGQSVAGDLTRRYLAGRQVD